MPETILITGAAGFIGQHLVKGYLAAGWRVIGLDAFTSPIDNSNYVHINDQVTRIGLRDIRRVYGPSVVSHHAAISSVAAADEDFEWSCHVNVEMTASLLKIFDEERVLLASSAAVKDPISLYGAQKLVSERLVELHEYATALRYHNIYGPGQKFGVVPALLKSAIDGKIFKVTGDGNQVRDFVYVKDLVKAHMEIMDNEALWSTTVSVGSGRQTSVNDLVNAVTEIAGTLEVQYVKSPSNDIYVSKITEETDSRFHKADGTSLIDGLRQTYANMTSSA